jgi:hypothetical protein
MEYRARLLVFVGAFFLGIGVEASLADTGLDTEAIEQAIGLPGQTQGEVFKLSLPRTDLSVSVDGLTLRPRFAMGSWVAFKPRGDLSVSHGDLVLLEKEVGPVMERLQEHGITFTALHNHLVRETPKLVYLHFWAEGPAEQIATRMRQALALTGTPLQKDTVAKEATPMDALPTERIEALLGRKGTVKDGVMSLAVPRPQPVTMNNVELPPSMGMATAINFQAGQNGKIAATGDFVLIASEVNAVAATLIRNGIQVTALHNHLVHGSPDLYFLHFWAHDAVESVTRGLKASLDVVEEKP